jgi:hypothetical protein
MQGAKRQETQKDAFEKIFGLKPAHGGSLEKRIV